MKENATRGEVLCAIAELTDYLDNQCHLRGTLLAPGMRRDDHTAKTCRRLLTSTVQDARAALRHLSSVLGELSREEP